MNDNYVEKLVKKKADAKTMLIRTGVIVLGLLIVYLSVVFLGYLSVAYYGLISVFLLVSDSRQNWPERNAVLLNRLRLSLLVSELHSYHYTRQNMQKNWLRKWREQEQKHTW